jgi:hypothetical protein
LVVFILAQDWLIFGLSFCFSLDLDFGFDLNLYLRDLHDFLSFEHSYIGVGLFIRFAGLLSFGRGFLKLNVFMLLIAVRVNITLETLLHGLLTMPLLADSDGNFHRAYIFFTLVCSHGDNCAHSSLYFVDTSHIRWLQWANFSPSFEAQIVHRFIDASDNVFEHAVGQRNLPHHYPDPWLNCSNIDQNRQIIIMQ